MKENLSDTRESWQKRNFRSHSEQIEGGNSNLWQCIIDIATCQLLVTLLDGEKEGEEESNITLLDSKHVLMHRTEAETTEV